jgi:hypothetical protein
MPSSIASVLLLGVLLIAQMLQGVCALRCDLPTCSVQDGARTDSSSNTMANMPHCHARTCVERARHSVQDRCADRNCQTEGVALAPDRMDRDQMNRFGGPDERGGRSLLSADFILPLSEMGLVHRALQKRSSPQQAPADPRFKSILNIRV